MDMPQDDGMNQMDEQKKKIVLNTPNGPVEVVIEADGTGKLDEPVTVESVELPGTYWAG